MHFVVGEVPIQRQSDESCSFPVHVDFILFLEYADEVICVFLSHVLDSEIIDYQSKADWPPLVLPETRCHLTLRVSSFIQLFGQLLLR